MKSNAGITGLAARLAYRGPQIFRDGFRVFFPAAALWAVVSVALWFVVLVSGVWLPFAVDALSWHSHEALFGFIPAAVAGFLLTAIPNWTGRLPVRGGSLALLFLLWVLGRLGMLFGGVTGLAVGAALDLMFLPALIFVILREIVAGKNWRNLPVAAGPTVLFLANLVFHLEYWGVVEGEGLGLCLGISAILMLIGLIGGRIIPSFTRNWLVKRKADSLPAPFGRFDRSVLGVTLLSLLIWIIWPESRAAGVALLVAGALNACRLARWLGLLTRSEPLLWVLHLAYAWLVLGLVLLGLAQLSFVIAENAAIHALTAGAMGTMILAVMTRASLGHTGRPLTAGPGTTGIFWLVTLGAALRVSAAAFDAAYQTVLTAGAVAWIGAFVLFLWLYCPLLWRRAAEVQAAEA